MILIKQGFLHVMADGLDSMFIKCNNFMSIFRQQRLLYRWIETYYDISSRTDDWVLEVYFFKGDFFPLETSITEDSIYFS